MPTPRGHHAACEIGKSQLLVFGGYGAANARLNDYYVLKNAGNSYTWSQPASYKKYKDLRDTPQALPEPRANHTLTFVREINKAFMFGGHGGLGYGRRAFNDLYQFDCETFEWTRIEAKGTVPEARGGHVAGQLPNGLRLFVHGGWSSVSQFNKMFIYDIEKNSWSEVNVNFDSPRWNHSAVVVPALPLPKLFIFGGSTGFFEEGAPRNFGSLTNIVMYFDILDNMDNIKLKRLALEGDTAPKARENSSLIYDQVEHRLVVHGGWSNGFNCDLYQLAVDAITGPEFAIYSIEPVLGPVTGGTKCRIKGEGFKPGQALTVRFSAGKSSAEVSSVYVSENELACDSPNFENFGPKECEVRLLATKDDPTIVFTNFSYFLNTKAEKTIAFGPALVGENSTQAPTHFFIQARNIHNENRKSGVDVFKVKIRKLKEIEAATEDPKGLDKDGEPAKEKAKEAEKVPEEEENWLEYEIEDFKNGQHEVRFTQPDEGRVEVAVYYLNESRQLELIRGAPFIATFSHAAPVENNSIKGNMMKSYVQHRLEEIETFISKTKKELELQSSKGGLARVDLLKIKQKIQEINETKDKMMLDLEVINQTVSSMNEKERTREQELSKNLIKHLNSLHKDSEEVKVKIKEDVTHHSQACLAEIEAFEDELNQYFRDLKLRNIYRYATGVEGAFETLNSLDQEVAVFQKKLADFNYFAKMFEFEDKPANCVKHMEAIQGEIQIIRKLWTHIKKTLDVFSAYLKSHWANVNPVEMQEEIKNLNKGLNQLKGIDRKSNVYNSIFSELKNWNLFLPIVEELKKDAMNVPDDRHWKKFKTIIGREFKLQSELPLSTLWDFEIYSVKFKEQIEELTEQATQERKIERDLEKIASKWRLVEFERVPLQLKEVHISTLKVADENIETLDEHQLLIQSIASNKYLAHYEEEVTAWQKGLSTVNETVRLLSEV